MKTGLHWKKLEAQGRIKKTDSPLTNKQIKVIQIQFQNNRTRFLCFYDSSFVTGKMYDYFSQNFEPISLTGSQWSTGSPSLGFYAWSLITGKSYGWPFFLIISSQIPGIYYTYICSFTKWNQLHRKRLNQNQSSDTNLLMAHMVQRFSNDLWNPSITRKELRVFPITYHSINFTEQYCSNLLWYSPWLMHFARDGRRCRASWSSFRRRCNMVLSGKPRTYFIFSFNAARGAFISSRRYFETSWQVLVFKASRSLLLLLMWW